MGTAIGTLLLALYVLWSGIATLRKAKRNGPTALDGLLPLRDRWLRIAWGVFLLLLSLLLGVAGVARAWWDIVLQNFS